jgi:hypothetical protein
MSKIKLEPGIMAKLIAMWRKHKYEVCRIINGQIVLRRVA